MNLPDYVTPDYLAALQLRQGKGSGKEGDRCALQERRAWSGLDPSIDAVPETDSKPCGRFLIRFQDAIWDAAERSRLCAPLLVKLVGSKGSPELERRRAWIAVDWALREVAPTWLDFCPELADHAVALRALPEVKDRASADSALAVRKAARKAAWRLRETKLAELRAKVREEVGKKAAAAAAAADDAAAYAAAYAADDAAAAYAAYAAAAAAAGSRKWKKIYDEVYQRVQTDARESRRSPCLKVWESGARCLDRMLDLREETAGES